MKKLKALFKLTIILSIVYALVVVFYLQEVNLLGQDFRDACDAAGVRLPLQDARVEISVGKKTLSVFEGARLIRRYDIGTGKNSLPGIRRRGANSTPLGEYEIVRKAKHEDLIHRGTRFLQLNYPSTDDLDQAYDLDVISEEEYERAYDALKNGLLVPDDLPVGGDIGIQGNYFPFLGNRFTDGSIALRNCDVNELFDHLPLGTPVIIRD